MWAWRILLRLDLLNNHFCLFLCWRPSITRARADVRILRNSTCIFCSRIIRVTRAYSTPAVVNVLLSTTDLLWIIFFCHGPSGLDTKLKFVMCQICVFKTTQRYLLTEVETALINEENAHRQSLNFERRDLPKHK